MKRESPGLFSRGAPELSLIIRQQAVRRGVGGWGAVQPAHEQQQHLCRGMGVLSGSPNNTTLQPAHCQYSIVH